MAGVLLQGGDASNSTLFLVLIAVVGACLVVQTAVIISFALGANRARREFLHIADEMRAKSVPVLEASRAILEDAAPKLRVLTDNLGEASFLLREQAERLDRTMKTTLNTVDAQVQRADAMVSSTLDNVEEVTSTVHRAIMIPVRQIAGLMNGLRAAVENFSGSKLGRALYSRDEDDFV